MTVHDCPTRRHPAGTRACYVTHRCRCPNCTKANRAYYHARHRRLAEETWGARPAALVDAQPTRTILTALRNVGVGLRTIADATGISRTTLWHITHGDRDRVRRDTADAIAGLRPDDVRRPGARVPARRTHQLVKQLVDDGWTKAAIGAWVTGNPDCRALQIRGDQITQASADAVADLADRWSRWDVRLNQRPDPTPDPLEDAA